MKFPALKREIHSLLIRRVVSVCILASLLAVAAICYLEIQRVKTRLLSDAEKESHLFLPLFLEMYHNHSGLERIAVPSEYGDAISRTSFVDIRLLNVNQELFYLNQQDGAAEIAARFADQGPGPVFADEPHGTWIFADKQLFLNAIIPARDANQDTVIGYLQAIYRSSAEDTRAIATRILLSCLIGIGSIALVALLLYPALVLLHNRLIKTASELNRANNFLLKQLGSALAKSDVGAAGHNYRVIIYGVRLAEKLKLTRAQIRNYIQGAFLHDIGMLETDQRTLLKPGPLDEKERKKMQEHVKMGGALIKPYRWLKASQNVIAFHHEKYDGSGYPSGISQDKIPIEARIFAIADAFDALSSDRPYRQAREPGSVIDALELESGAHFDPVLLAPFIEMAPQLLSIVSKLEGKSLEKEVNGVLKKYLKL